MHRIDRSIPFFFTLVRGTRIPVTSQLVADVLRVPRIEFLDYPSCEHLRTVSRDKLMSSFCERPTAWGKRLFTPCRPFAKSPRFMNMVMTFFLHPLSHYNSITEPRARFLLSLLEHLTIDFPSYFILSIIDVHLDLAVISSSFLPLSQGFYAIFPFLFPLPTTLPSCVPQIMLPLNVARPSFGHDRRIQQHPPLVLHHPGLLHLHPLLFLQVMYLQETSWRSCSAWMLAWIHSL